jgi:heat shock protein HslJ
MRRKFIVFALAVGAAILLVGCSSSGSDLTGKEWQLTTITEKIPAFQGVVPAAEQVNYTITFNTDGTYTGKADCNQIAGKYKTSGSNELTIEPGVSTMAFCPEGSFGDLYVHALGRTKSYAIASGALTLTQRDAGTLNFVVAPTAASPAASTAATAAAASATPKPTAKPTAKPTTAPPAPSAAPTAAPSKAPGASATPAPVTGLVGKVWQLTNITTKVPPFQGAVPVDQQPNYTIEFQADGTFSAKADCNTVAGKYTAADPAAASGTLTLALGPTTTVACPDGSLSDLYLLGLSNTASYANAAGALTITLVDEGTLVYK